MINRRDLLRAGTGIGATTIAAAAALPALAKDEADPTTAFHFCFNTSTIRGQKLPVPDQFELAAKAGYEGVEPWVGDLREYVQNGGDLAALRKRIEDLGLVVPSAIGFSPWIVDDENERQKGLESARDDMRLVRAIGGVRLAAPPVGATEQTNLNLFQAADRYHALLEIGQQEGVVPELELWGFSKSLSRLGELMFVATESRHPSACVLPDVYHVYKGGSDFSGLRMINGKVIHVFHMNDYPANPPRETITDADRVYPGDGIAPLNDLLRMLYENGFRGMLSLELFNRELWKQDPLTVAKTGIEKMKAAVAKAFG